MERYRSFGVPRSDGLFEMNFFVLRLDQPGVADFERVWWQEIESHSHRDQLSIGWALKQSGLGVTSLLPPGFSTRNHEDFSRFPHE
jgi:hypothetical protein